VKLEISNDRPLIALFEFPGDAGCVKYSLAPKVDDEGREE
jgi:hypothetical protein